MDKHILDLDAKYKNIEYGNFYDSSLLTKREKKFIGVLENTQYIVIFGLFLLMFVYKSNLISDSFIAIAFIVILSYGIFAVFYCGRFIMRRCVALLGKEYFDYKEELLRKEYGFLQKINQNYEKLRSDLLLQKKFDKGYCVQKKRFSLMFTKGVVYYFDYNFIVFFDEIPSDKELAALLKKKYINLVFCLKTIEQKSVDVMTCDALVESGYNEKMIDTIIVRFANIYFEKNSNQIIHRPRVVLLQPEDHFLKRLKYTERSSVVVDYSLDVSNFLITKILRIRID